MARGSEVADPALRHVDVDIWSDVVCPWCWIGKRRFERAVAALASEIAVDSRYRAYQLDPTASPGRSEPVAAAYARKFGGPERAAEMIAHVTSIAREEGLDFHLERALRANTVLAHQLIWLAAEPSSPVSQPVMAERLMLAYFSDGVDIGDPDTLVRLANELGLRAVDACFAGTEGRAQVELDLARAAELGITAVPTFVIEGRWAIPGAQETDTFVAILRKAASDDGDRQAR